MRRSLSQKMFCVSCVSDFFFIITFYVNLKESSYRYFTYCCLLARETLNAIQVNQKGVEDCFDTQCIYPLSKYFRSLRHKADVRMMTSQMAGNGSVQHVCHVTTALNATYPILFIYAFVSISFQFAIGYPKLFMW